MQKNNLVSEGFYKRKEENRAKKGREMNCKIGGSERIDSQCQKRNSQ